MSAAGVKMTGLGVAIPQKVITNEDLSQWVDTSDEWIVTRTGIKERHIVGGNETVADLAIEATQKALAVAGIEGKQVDLIIACSSTPDNIYPAVSCQIHEAIGAGEAAGFDMAIACSGFVYGMVIAEQFVRTGAAKTVVVAASDIHSRFVDWKDRNTCILFGDGAGACVLQATEANCDDFLGSQLRIDGNKGHWLTMGTTMQNAPLVNPREIPSPFVQMNGKEVFKFAVSAVPQSISEVLEKSGMSMSDLDFVVLHQANSRIIDAVSERLNVPKEKMLLYIEKYGNTSAASIPLALHEAMLAEQIHPGQKIVMTGFGAGLAWGTAVMNWRIDPKRYIQTMAQYTAQMVPMA